MNRTHAVGLVLLIVAACGGMTDSTGQGSSDGTGGSMGDGSAPSLGEGGLDGTVDDCSEPDEWITSTRAIGIFRCRGLLEPGDVVVRVGSQVAGVMDEQGRSPQWTIFTWNSETRETRLIGFVNGTAEVINESSDGSCPDPPSADPAPSDEVVPDAMERFAPIDPYENKRFTARSFNLHIGPCFGPTRTKNGVGIVRSTNVDNIVAFFLEYSWAGEFARICGPCPGSGSTQCDDNCR